MKWRGMRGSANVEDRRGMRVGRGGLAAGGGIGTIIIVVIVLLMGGDPSQIVAPSGVQTQGGSALTTAPGQDELAQFVSVILASTEDAWQTRFADSGETYRAPKLVLFTEYVQSACGSTSSAVGPFYCPADETVYIDLGFYDELSRTYGAPGDFAQAYVIAHEVGHHVQKLLGISSRVDRLRQTLSQTESNQQLVRLELQADFLSGVWAHDAKTRMSMLEAGDIEEGLNAASAIGDDRLQREAQGRVVPDSFTHGTSQQRAHWFKLGFDTGDMSQGDTFSSDAL